MIRVLRCVVVVVVWLSVLASARAQQNSEARVHFDRATSAFALGRFDDAALEYEKAFDLKPDPALLYDAAQSHRKAGNKHRALLLFQNYLRVYGHEAKNRGEVSRTVADLKAAIARDGTTEDPPRVAEPVVTPVPVQPQPVVVATPQAAVVLVEAPTPPPRKPLVKKAWFWGVVAGSVVVVGGAVALGVILGSTTHDPGATLGGIKVNN
ncbi:MAG: tetratricopeptide repeat protein [Polyangia bacterium]